MTTRIKLAFSILMLVFCNTVFAQDDQSIPDMTVMAVKDYDDVRLRWMVANMEIWDLATIHGFNLGRVDLDTDSIEVLAQGIKPLKEADWDIIFPGNNMAMAAKNLLYNTTGQSTGDDIERLVDLYEHKQQEESKHLFIMMAAEGDFDVAEGLALAYKDKDADSGGRYLYRLSINDSLTMLDLTPALFSIDLSETNDLPQIDSVYGYGGETEIFVEWDEDEYEKYYSSYDVERSTDGITWGVCNPAPFVAIEYDGFEKDNYTYRDPVPNTTLDYFYRVRGRTPFGIFGPYSDAVILSCKTTRMDLDCDFDGYELINDDVLLNWYSFPQEYEDNIVGFNVFRTQSLSVKSEKINLDLIDKTKRDYLDSESLERNSYYFIEAVGVDDYRYQSKDLIVRKDDFTPPSLPTGLQADLLNFNKVRLTWDANTDEDLRGYQLLLSDERDGEYFKISDNTIIDEKFDYNINEELAFDSLFFMLKAEDTRRNQSECTAIVAIERPDIFGPASPVLSSVYAKPTGIFVDWRYSKTDDVEKHELQRRLKNGYDSWHSILVVDNNEQDNYPDQGSGTDSYNFIDSTELKLEQYLYRFIAIDEAGNEGASQSMVVFPFKAAVDGVVSNFEMELEGGIQRPDARLNTELEKIKGKFENIDQIKSLPSASYKVRLKWIAELDYQLSHFQIYKSAGAGNITPFKMLTPEEGLGIDGDYTFTADSGPQDFKFEDDKIKKGKRYSYYIVAVYRDGSESKRSSTLTKKIPTN